MYTADLDVGGTFTDGFFTDGAESRTGKVLTTPHDLTECFLNCLSEGASRFGVPLRDFLRDCLVVRLSTTLGTNTLLQRRGPTLGLIVERGHEQDLYGDGPAPAGDLFLRPGMVVGISSAPEDEEVLLAARTLVNLGARMIAVSLRDAQAEQALRAVVLERYPVHYLRSIPLQLSHEVSYSSDAHTRTNTVALNAYLHGELARGLFRADDLVRDNGLTRPLLVVHASGGCARVAKTVAVQTLSSGPAVAVNGVAALAELLGEQNVVTADMGGTSLDVAVLQGARPAVVDDPWMAGLHLSVPMIETESLGAGGGSIAKVVDGQLQVGPQSAGSAPGPACYDKGGVEPTVTDANLVLGLIDPDRFLGGRMALNRDRAEQAIARRVGRQLEGSTEDLAMAIRSRVNEGMAGLIGSRLDDPGSFTLFAFGGGGPLHGCGLADLIGIRRVVGFPFGSVFSAFGSSTADVRHEYAGKDPGALRRQAEVDMRGEGFPASDIRYEAGTRDGRATLSAWAPTPHWLPVAASVEPSRPEPKERRAVRWEDSVEAVPTPVFQLAELARGAELDGPAIIEAADSSYAVNDGWGARIDEWGNIVMERTLPDAG
ncbi:MAG: hydantoinase/oxoprolinase family protein [Mycobacteriales bacterium]